jgi:hypothetical protein
MLLVNEKNLSLIVLEAGKPEKNNGRFDVYF